MRGLRRILLALLATTGVLLLAGSGAGSAATVAPCYLTGPHWTLYPAHSDTAHHGTVYFVVPTGVSCLKAKGYVRTLWKRNPRWPYAGSGGLTLKGAPAGWRCGSTVESRRNRREYAGDCLFLTGGPSMIRHFSFGPHAPGAA